MDDDHTPPSQDGRADDGGVVRKAHRDVEPGVDPAAHPEAGLAHAIRKAREAAGLTQGQLANLVGFSREYVSRAERPAKGLASQGLVEAIDRTVEAGGALVALRRRLHAQRLDRRAGTPHTQGPTPPREEPPPVVGSCTARTSQGADAVASTPSSVDAAFSGEDPRDVMQHVTLRDIFPSEVGRSEVEQVRSLTVSLAMTENMFGGACAAATAPAALRWATGLLSARSGPTVRDALFEAVGNLAGVVGFIAFDIEDHRAARRMSDSALWCAEQGRSWTLRAAVLADRARFHAAAGEVEEALTAIEFARVREDRLTATGRAALTAGHAQLLARVGRRDAARAAVETADEEFAGSDPEQDSPWLAYYDAAEHAGSTARALLPLDRHEGRPGLAADRLMAAVAGQSQQYPRSRAFSVLRLAALHMQVGDPRDAVAVARGGLEAVSEVRSRRMAAEVNRFVLLARPHNHIPDVADLLTELESSAAPDLPGMAFDRRR